MKHIKQIDGLRFIAVFFVLIEHFATAIGRYFEAGFYGVDLFFTISGFLITGILINTKEPFGTAYKKFLGRRTLRIFPLYYAVVAILYLLHHPFVQQYIFNFLTYTYNYAWVKYQIRANSASHFWSLSVEEQFYLFWPILMLLFRANKMALQILFIAILIICGLQFSLHIFPSIEPYNVSGLFPRAYSLVMGAVGAFLIQQNKVPIKLLENKITEISVFVILILTLLLSNDSAFQFIICPICSLFIIYGVYIFHFPLGAYLTEYCFDPLWNKINFAAMGKLAALKYNSWIIKLPIYTLLSIVLAHFSFNYFEKPILKLKDKLFKYS
ncbi:MAG: acyltransferase [Bacteroidetes bacterium]|nr:acyltransferase [Bacteroidota bacterium]